MFTSLKNKSMRGFTLIELLVVIAIIGLLAAAITAGVSSAKTRAKDAKVKTEMSSIQLALEDFAIEKGGYPNPGSYIDAGGITRFDWCIGGTDCVIGGTLVERNISEKYPDLFPSYPNSVSFQDDANPPNTNKGYVYVSCESSATFCPETPSESNGSDIAYLVYPKSDTEKSLQVGTFAEQLCSLPVCEIPNSGSNLCGPQNNIDCALYTNQNAGACNYDPDGTGIITTMCICGPQHNDSCTKYCGNPYIGSCNFDSNGTGQAWSQACTATCGCMDPDACNYAPQATVDTGNCEYTSCLGGSCGDPTACNYGASGQCNYDCWTFGCTDEIACNYDPNAHTDDGTCEYVSCHDLLIPGCTDGATPACNYDPEATEDDGSCDYSCQNNLCEDGTACNYLGTLPCEYSSCHGSYCSDPSACNYDEYAECEYSSCLGLPGCTTELACNFNPSATVDDGSCSYSCYGCTDSYACNYNPGASLNDNSCEYSTCAGCTDTNACNYAGATIENGSCDYNC